MLVPSPCQELEGLVVEQICIFNERGKMNDTDILEYPPASLSDHGPLRIASENPDALAMELRYEESWSHG